MSDEQLAPRPGSLLTAQGSSQPARATVVDTLIDDRLRVVRPLPAELSREDAVFVVWSEDLQTHGEGDSPAEAIDDFRIAVAELYWELKDDRDRLGPALQPVWELLRQSVAEA